MEKIVQTEWKIGFHSWPFRRMPLEEALKRIREAGFTEVEINADKTHLDPRVFPRSKLPHLKKLLNDLGLHPNSVHAPFYGVDLSTQSPEIKRRSIELLTKTLEYCRAIECQIMVTYPNSSESLPLGREAVKKNSVEALREVVKKAEELGVKVAIENMIGKDERFCSRISDLIGIIESVGSPYLGICLDTGHINLLPRSVTSMREEILHAGKYLWTLHIHDNDGERDSHLPMGEGNIDWSQVIKALREINYKGVFLMEIQEREDPDELARECLRIASDMLRA